MRIGVFVLTVGLVACGSDSPTGPSSRPLTRTETSAHYTFHTTDTDRVDVVRQEAFHDWVLPQLGVSSDRTLHYYKYVDRSHMAEITGRTTNGFAEPASFTLHSIWTFDAHEAIHVLTAVLGVPPDFFNEGIAVALNFDPLAGRFVALWNTTTVHDAARSAFASSTSMRPVSLLTSDRFQAQTNTSTYPLAGSFVGFLIDRYGEEPMNQFFRSSTGRGESEAQVRQRVINVWGKPIETLQDEWIAFLRP